MSDSSGTNPGGLDPVQHFFRYFQLQAAAIQDQISRLVDVPTVATKRANAIDQCLVAITRLQSEVQEASSYTTSYDQKTYLERIKALHEQLEQTRASLVPKSKFSFKSSLNKSSPSVSLNDAAEASLKQRKSPDADTDQLRSDGHSTKATTSDEPYTKKGGPSPPTGYQLSEDLERSLESATIYFEDGHATQQTHLAVRKTSSPMSNAVDVSSKSDVHIVLPSSTSRITSSGSLIDLRHCFVDLTGSTSASHHLAGLTVKDIRQCLLICGHVSGAAHVTNMEETVLLVTAKQLRMHNCKNCIVYIHVSSRPVIEDCTNIQFAPLPKEYLFQASDSPSQNQWYNVQDFNWPKASPSPNWRELLPNEAIAGDVWLKLAQADPERSLEDILDAVGIQ